MASVSVLNWKKEKVDTVELDPSVFEVALNKTLLHSVVRWQLASRRQGTHATKTKGLVSGGGKKPFKQKGTGGARQGSNRSILMPGGGTAFGPQPRSYKYELPKKMRKGALSIALSHLLREGRLLVVDSMESKGKTKELFSRLKVMGLNKAVLVDAVPSDSMLRVSGNLENFKYCGVNGVNLFDLLKYDGAILTKQSIENMVQRCKIERSK